MPRPTRGSQKSGMKQLVTKTSGMLAPATGRVEKPHSFYHGTKFLGEISKYQKGADSLNTILLASFIGQLEISSPTQALISKKNIACKSISGVKTPKAYCPENLALREINKHQESKDTFEEKWVPNDLMKLYMDFCEKATHWPNLKLLSNLEVSEDEINASDCALDDVSILPFLHALEGQRAVASLDISHNSLGNETMEKIQKIFNSSEQKYGDLTLDLHCNQFGPAALFQICECPVMFTRIEVLNLSQNPLTDACGLYLTTILENCKALYCLKINQCSITSVTIQKLTDSLHEESKLKHISIGNNNPISGNIMVNLLSKLSSLKRFSELSVTGLRLDNHVVESLCQLTKSSYLSAFFLGGTNIGADGAVRITEALSHRQKKFMKLDLASCGITWDVVGQISTNIVRIKGIVELNLGGNFISEVGCYGLECMLSNPRCKLKSLVLDRCHLGFSGILRIVAALEENKYLEELCLAGNSSNVDEKSLECHFTTDAARVSDTICSQVVKVLFEAIYLTKKLLLLDLSNNHFSSDAIEKLYMSWDLARSRSAQVAYKHVEENQILHFCIVGRKCCGIRSCCIKYVW